ncbi:MAG: GFA family protein [Telmatospirillum sp.]|nr:GFA family protein [Telmatospirillum sp.]
MRGQCLCGAVTFELSGPVPGFYQCHCSLCRRQSGAASNAATLVPPDRFRWLTGADRIGAYVRSSGYRVHFCKDCASPVPNPTRGGSLMWIPAGLLEDDPAIRVVAHLHVASRASWDRIPDDVAAFDTMPDIAALIALLDPGAVSGHR